jgi:ABC-type Na+ efflux pump permease subunit
MSQCLLVLRKEWLNFVRSDKSVFFIYLFLIIGWGMLLATMNRGGSLGSPLWLVFFSVIIAANFSGTVFVSERMSGSLEILLTSGLSRGAILWGKMMFVIIMTLAVGVACILAASVLQRFMAPPEIASVFYFQWTYVALYAGATFLNTTSCACFSVWLPNPRLLHFVNIALVGCIMAGYVALSLSRPLSLFLVAFVMSFVGILFAWLARRAFESERIIKPVIF